MNTREAQHGGAMGRRGAAALVGALLAFSGLAMSATAQLIDEPATAVESPVFVNESSAAVEGLMRVTELANSGALDQAASLCSRLLVEEADALIASASDASLYSSCRARLHAVLLAKPALLERYRSSQSALAVPLLEKGRLLELERSWLLTPSGLEAVLRLVQLDIESARIGAATRRLDEISCHPDLTGKNAKDAAELTAMLAKVSASGAKARPVISPMGPVPMSKLSGLVAKPLWSAQTGSDEPIVPRFLPPGYRTAEPLPRFGRELRVMPTLVGDTLIVSQGLMVQGLDAATLQPRWVFDLHNEGLNSEQVGARQSYASEWEDVSSVEVTDSLVIAAISAEASSDSPEQRLIALDLKTGEKRWSIEPGRIDRRLAEQGVVRGPVVEHEGVVVVSLRKRLPERRLSANYVAGIELATGKALWMTQTGSSGMLPWPNILQISTGCTASEGVVYRMDRLGVVGAIEVATGAPLWVRRLSPESVQRAQSSGFPYQSSAPVVIGGHVFVVSPDRASVLKINAKTGVIAASMPSESLGSPAYLLSAGERLIAVEDRHIAIVDSTKFEPGAFVAMTSGTIPMPGIRGRVVVSGDELIVPVVGGAQAYRIDDLSKVSQSASLDMPGNVMPVGSQVIVADDAHVHLYSTWDEAQRVLIERTKQSPGDASSAIALLELATRTGRNEQAVQATKLARGAIDAGRREIATSDGTKPDAEKATAIEGQRQRLVSVLVTFIDGRQAEGASAADDRVAMLVQELVGVSESPNERATAGLLDAAQLALQGKATEAVARCQSVLEDATLSEAQYATPRATSRADAEATRRVEEIVRTAGRGVYAAYDARASARLAVLTPIPKPGEAAAIPDANELENLARMYPVSISALKAWSLAAAAHDAGGRGRLAARAAELGLLRAQAMSDAPTQLVGELGGRLVVNLQSRGLLTAAADSLRRMKVKSPGVVLTRNGSPLDVEALSRELASLMAIERRAPRIGRPIGEGVQDFPSWALMEPLKVTAAEAGPTGFLVMQHDDGRIAIMGMKAAEPAGADDAKGAAATKPVVDSKSVVDAKPGTESRLVPLWESPSPLERTALVRSWQAGALFVHAGDDRELATAVMFRVDVKNGGALRLWESQPLGAYFAGSNRIAMPIQMRSPLDGARSPYEILALGDERASAMVQRSGRSVVLDSETGEKLWAGQLSITRLTDATLASGLLIVAGELMPAAGQVATGQTVIGIFDARTGQMRHTVPTPGNAAVRWLRLTPRGELIVGLENEVVNIDLETGATDWSVTKHPAASTIDAWVVDEQLLVMTEERSLWLMSTATGQRSPAALDTRSRIDGSTTRVGVSVLDGGGFAVRTSQGLMMYDRAGKLTACDALSPGDGMLVPVQVHGGFVTVSHAALPGREGPGGRDSGLAFNFMSFDSASGMLKATVPMKLRSYASAVVVIDGRVAVSAGSRTIVFQAPD